MSLPVQSFPPDSQTSYAISQLEGERITIPGSKGVFRILASAKQTAGGIAVFQSGAVFSDAPGFHYHNHAHDLFLVSKGYLKLWNGDKCHILGPGDFAYVPPKIIHNPEMLGPHTELYGLVAPGDWVDFFRHVSEPYEGILVPENDNRDLKALLIPKVMAAKDKFDVVFQPDYKPPPLSEWTGMESVLPNGTQPYFLRANTGPRWMAGGIMSRPFITTAQCDGKFAISSIESSNVYGKSIFSRYMSFTSVTHCFCVLEGTLLLKLKDNDDYNTVREGETAVIAAGEKFTLEFGSKYVRALSFTTGKGVEHLIQRLGQPFEGYVLPDQVQGWDETQLGPVCAESGVEIEL